MITQPAILLLNVTNRCNLSCTYCFGPEDKTKKDPTFQELKEDIQSAREKGYNTIIFSGGEPLLRDDTVQLVELAKKNGLQTILHTNGILLNKNIFQKLCNYLDQINIPIDGATEEVNGMFRGDNHLAYAKKALELVKDSGVRVVVSTVVTAKNSSDIKPIITVLPKWIFKWRVFQFKKTHHNTDVAKELSVSKDEFGKLCNELQSDKTSFIVQCVFADDKEFYSSYKEQ
ncbi:radical SAM protein [Patescibacteria group bacterium]|nr:radical SAM protein [Patescibacteria group bacterium]